MKEDFVTYEIAVKLKEKGFDELCLLHYTNEQILVQNSMESRIGDTIGVDDILDSYNRFNNECTDVPTISQALKWLRDVKNIHIEIRVSFGVNRKWWWVVANMNDSICDYSEEEFDTYEESVLAGIKFVIYNLI